MEERYYDRLEAREAGLAEGRVESVVRLVCRKLRKSCSAEQISEDLEEDIVLISEICQVAERFAPEYAEEEVWEHYREIYFGKSEKL